MAKRLRFISRGFQGSVRKRTNLCILFADGPRQAAIKQLEINAAVVEMADAPDIGTAVELHHPEVGVLSGRVVGVVRNTARIAFGAGDRATRLAGLSVISCVGGRLNITPPWP